VAAASRKEGGALPGSDDDSAQTGVVDCIRRALAHAEGAIRCYAALFAVEAERRMRRALDQAVWTLALVGFGLIGVALIAFGVARHLENWTGAPGSGAMMVGGAMVGLFLAAMIFRWSRKQ
jgi:hypothetical protein